VMDAVELVMPGSRQMSKAWDVADRRIELSQMSADEAFQLLENSIEACNDLSDELGEFPRQQVEDMALIVERLKDEASPSNEWVQQWLAIDEYEIDVSGSSSFWKVGVAMMIAKKRQLVNLTEDVFDWLPVDCDWYNEEIAYFISECNDKDRAAKLLQGFPQLNKEYGQLYIAGAVENMTPYPDLEPYLKGAIESAEDMYTAINLIAYLIQIGTETSIALAERKYFDIKDVPDAEQLRRLFLCHYVFNGQNPAKVQKYQREVEADHKKFLKMRAGFDSMGAVQQGFQGVPDLDYSPQEPVVRTESKVKVGRNELCPCGSGKKYKKCCL